MNIRMYVAGKPSLSYARSGVEEYLKRLGRYGSYELVYLRAGASDKVSKDLLARTEGHYRIAMDERGRAMDTAKWTEALADLEMSGEVKNLSFLIGAADGHTEELRATSNAVWKLSALTMQHELALVVLLEQLYRVATIRRGEPYHR